MIKVLKLVPGDFTKESRDLREILALIRNGFHVEVFAWKSGEINETRDLGFPIHRFQIGYRNDAGAAKKILCYLKFGWECIKGSDQYAPDMISAHDLPALIIAMLIKFKRSSPCKVVYDSHELTSEMASNRHQPKIVVNIKRLTEGYFIKKVDAVMVVSDSIAKYNYEKFNLEQIPYVVRNIPDKSDILGKSRYFRDKYNIKESQTILLYQGAIRAGRGINKLLEVMDTLDDNFVLIIMGYGDVDSVQKQIAERQLEKRVFLHEAVPYHDLVKYSNGADIGISLIENYCLSYYYSLPNKLFEYIQAGIPVICSNFPDMTAIVSEYKVGETADPEDTIEIKNKIQLASEKLKKGEYKESLDMAKAELCWEMEQLKLLDMYKDILKKKV